VWAAASQRWWPLAASRDARRWFIQAEGGSLAALDAATGAPMWAVPDAAGPMAVDGAQLYVNHAGHLSARSARDGSIIWDRTVGNDLGQPVVAGGLLYAVSGAHGVLVLNKHSGAIVYTRLPRTKLTGHAVVVNGGLYLTNAGGVDMYSL
jgi:outer membrane protein assembly factor BamB